MKQSVRDKLQPQTVSVRAEPHRDVLEYAACYSGDLALLIEQVNAQVYKGWKPQGGISVRADGLLIQAMVK